jgi:ferric-dicitrate binding protein FerR (iron transport regulator)
MIVYVEPSALLTLVVDEPVSSQVEALWWAADCLVTAGTTLDDALAALLAGRRLGRLTSPQCRAATAAVRGLWSQLAIVQVDEALEARAAELAQRHRFRQRRGIHLAAALAVAADVFATVEPRLVRAAGVNGINALALPG